MKCEGGENINFKEKNYSELTFHYWFWKNKIKEFSDDDWIGFCQKRRFWLNSRNENLNNELEKIILKDFPSEWTNYNAVICEPIKLGTKLMKLLKRGWRNLLSNPKILLLDDVREVFYIALNLFGYDVNTINEEEIKNAYIK